MEEKKMEDWTRVVLYGTYDGFTRSTVEPLQIAVRLDNGERVEIPSECVMSADQIVKKDEIKLEDVIKRIEGFEFGTQVVWVGEILNELGSDYGSFKYKQGYEQGKLEGEWVGRQLKDADKIRLELNKPVVPQFVANWYEGHKDDFENALFRSIDLMPSTYKEGELSEFEEWLVDEHTKPFQILVNMHQFGYTVEEEKRYLVKVKGIDTNFNFLNRHRNENYWIFSSKDKNTLYQTHHTRKQLEDAGFGEVFNSTLFEVEEVED